MKLLLGRRAAFFQGIIKVVGKALPGLFGCPRSTGTGALFDFFQLLDVLADRSQIAVNLSVQLFEADVNLVREGRIFHLGLSIIQNGFVFWAPGNCSAKIVPCSHGLFFLCISCFFTDDYEFFIMLVRLLFCARKGNPFPALLPRGKFCPGRPGRSDGSRRRWQVQFAEQRQTVPTLGVARALERFKVYLQEAGFGRRVHVVPGWQQTQ